MVTVAMYVELPSGPAHTAAPRRASIPLASIDRSPVVQFQQRFIENGVEGGKQAAYALRRAILKECHEFAGEIEVIVKYIANLQGLTYITRASNTVASDAVVKAFTLGFTQCLASFDFIDVGQGKERADTKIKGEPPCSPGRACRMRRALPS